MIVKNILVIILIFSFSVGQGSRDEVVQYEIISSEYYFKDIVGWKETSDGWKSSNNSIPLWDDSINKRIDRINTHNIFGLEIFKIKRLPNISVLGVRTRSSCVYDFCDEIRLYIFDKDIINNDKKWSKLDFQESKEVEKIILPMFDFGKHRNDSFNSMILKEYREKKYPNHNPNVSEDIKSGILKEEHYDITDNSELLYPLIANFVRLYTKNEYNKKFSRQSFFATGWTNFFINYYLYEDKIQFTLGYDSKIDSMQKSIPNGRLLYVDYEDVFDNGYFESNFDDFNYLIKKLF